jgi:uncharacterized protein YqeY
MLVDTINTLIREALPLESRTPVTVLRDIKAAILNWKTAKENVGKTYTEVDEINILKKLKTQYLETAESCNDGQHDSLVQAVTEYAEYINQFLPAPVTKETIQQCVEQSGIALDKKNMGNIIKYVKAQYPAADGKLVADVVKSYVL